MPTILDVWQRRELILVWAMMKSRESTNSWKNRA